MLKTYAIGNLTHNVDVINKKNKRYALIQLACNQGKKTQFINCLINDRLTNCLQFAQKGRLLSVSGDLKIKKIKTKSSTYYYTYISANDVQLL